MKSLKKGFLMLTSVAMAVGALLIGGSVKKTETVEAAGQTVTYTVDTKTSVTVSSGVEIPGSVVSYTQTYSTKGQMTSGNSTTLTINAPGYKLNSLVLSMKSNSSKGAGSLSVNGSEIITRQGFNTSYWHGAYSTSYVDVDVSEKIKSSGVSLSLNNDFSIIITATANSLYIQSYTIGYIAESAKVTYDLNGGNLNGSTSIPESAVELGSLLENPGSLTHSTDTNKIFMGWYYTDSNGLSKKWEFATDTVTSNLTLTAKWGYEVTINPNNGSVIGKPITVLEGTKISELVPTETPEKGGYKFVGWKKVIGEETTDITDGDLVTSKLEIKAVWAEITTPLVFVETENEINEGIVNYYVDQEFTLSAVVQNATAISYTWEMVDDSTDPVLTNLSNSLDTKDIKFKANKIGDVYISISVSISEASEPISYELYVSITHPITDIATNAWLGISYNDTREYKTIDLDISRGSYGGSFTDSTKPISDLLTDSTDFSATYMKNSASNAYIKTDVDVRLYPGSGNGSSIEIARNESSSMVIKKVTVTFSKSTDSALCGISVDGGTTYTNCESNTEYIFENATSLSIKNTTSASSSNQIKVTKVVIELQSGEIEFTNIRARFGITIPADMYQFESIESANVSFNVYISDAENPAVATMTDANKTVNEDGSITYVVSVTNIPLANCTDLIHVVPTIIINGHSYVLTGTAYSVNEMVDVYLGQEALMNNEFLKALKASIDALNTNVA